jgi:hypothetical protein
VVCPNLRINLFDSPRGVTNAPTIDGSRQRPFDTVKPLADDLSLTVDTSCDRDDADCVNSVVKGYKGSGNILICWEHHALTDIVSALGAGKKAPVYPGDKHVYSDATLKIRHLANTLTSFNIIWTNPSPYKKIANTTSENCPGLDG